MEKRVLIYAPTGQDAPLAARMLAMARIDSTVCATLAELARQLALGCGCVLTVEEALAAGGFTRLHDSVTQQPTWSDLPILLLTHRGADSLAVRQAVAALGNLTLLERPVRTLTLVTSLHALLRARQAVPGARGGAPQGRIPRQPRSRAAQPAGADPHLGGLAEPLISGRAASRTDRRRGRAPGDAPDAAGGRPARRGPHHQRKNRAAARTHQLPGRHRPRPRTVRAGRRRPSDRDRP